ncbi:MAG: nucleotidyltransferase family protein [Firmicutes bacterium]|nr:nucleotidyltransferase family protein [Bacillota bacterium]
MTQGIILAGGYSSRQHQNKMSLLYQNKELILHVIETMNDFVDKIIVVTGHFHQEIYDLISNTPKVEIIQNFNYDLGMFKSIQCAVTETSEDFFLIPGDYPFVKKSTYQALLKEKGEFIVPSFNNKLGHPLLISKLMRQEILQENCLSNLKIIRNRHQITYVNVQDEGILIDIDTVQDYELFIRNRKD